MALASTLAACSGSDPQPPARSTEPPAAIEPEPGDDVGAPGAGDPYYPNDGNGGYDAAGYRVAVTYDPARRHLAGTSTMTATATQNLRKFNLDLRKLEVKSVEVDDVKAEFSRKSSELTVTPDKPVKKGAEFTVRVRYAGKPSTEADTGGVGKLGWLSTKSGAAYALGEPHSASFWFPVNETPRDTATFQLAARVPTGWTAVSIGRQGKSTKAKGWTTYRWVERTPVASYLTTIAIDKFDLDTSRLTNGIPVVDAFAPGAEGKKQIAGRLDDVVQFLSDKFGPYPQSSAGGIYMAATIPFALETNGRPTYASWAELPVVVHEYAHQWFGNSVTLRSWSDICLNECLASYAEWLWAEAEEGADLDQKYRTAVEAAQEQFWRPKLHEMGSGKEFAGVYDKGALAMHALRAELGETVFDKTIRGWAKLKQHQNASWPEFEEHVQKVSGKDLGGFFDAWFRGTSKPAEKYLLPGKLGG